MKDVPTDPGSIREKAREVIRASLQDMEVYIEDDSTFGDMGCDRADIADITHRLGSHYSIQLLSPAQQKAFAENPAELAKIKFSQLVGLLFEKTHQVVEL